MQANTPRTPSQEPRRIILHTRPLLRKALPHRGPLAAGAHRSLQTVVEALPINMTIYKAIGEIFKHFGEAAKSVAEDVWFVPGLHMVALAMKTVNTVMENNRSADVTQLTHASSHPHFEVCSLCALFNLSAPELLRKSPVQISICSSMQRLSHSLTLQMLLIVFHLMFDC